MSLGPSPTQEQIDKQEYLNKKMKEFLAKGGKIEIIPEGMTGEEYYNKKPKLKKGRKKSSA